MSKIRVTLAGDTPDVPLGKNLPQGRKIRVTLDPASPPLLLSPEASEPRPKAAAPFPVPAKVLAFWNYDENAHQIDRPWCYAESPNEQSVREQAERDGVWTG
jgi:hypothetical protein